MSNSKEKKTSLIIIGAIILGVFISISMINLSGIDKRYLSTNIIKEIDYSDGDLTITTRSDMIAVCVKETKSDPEIDSLCWEDTINGKTTISIYEYKTYYIWTKDKNGVISYYNKYNAQKND